MRFAILKQHPPMPQDVPAPLRQSRRVPNILCALLAGILLGCAFPPVHWTWIVWIGLAPLLWAVAQSPRSRSAFLLGYVAGLTFFLITLHPLVSAHTWTGWAVQTPAQFAARMSRQWWFLQVVWVAFALWGALFWGLWAAAMYRVAGHNPWRTVVLAPSLWVVLTEWIRAKTTFGFTWAVLGNATADLAVIRQLAALGGVWLLSALVVLVNTGLALAIVQRREGRGWRMPLAVVVGCVALAWGWGRWRIVHGLSEPQTIQAAALQYTNASYASSDFDEVNLDRMYASMIEEAVLRKCRLIVVPESVALGAVTLDGSLAPEKRPSWQIPRVAWDQHISELLTNHDTLLLMGLYTVEHSQAHNSLVGWTTDGVVGWYHKRRLVPYAEYRPVGWQWAIHGIDQYVPGQGSQLISWESHRIGGFICQEVLIPWVAHQSVRDGAELLVSGGNDGVFANPAAAESMADVAQLRAVENGRYVIRAMKTGISAIIDPLGHERTRGDVNQLALLEAKVSFQQGLTPYVRFGDWVVGVSALVCLGLGLSARGRRRQP